MERFIESGFQRADLNKMDIKITIVNKLPYFKNLLELLEKECPAEHPGFKYIGTGNPSANILIVGKETAIASDSKEQIVREMEKNFHEWKKNLKDNDLSKIEIKECDWANPNPLYPYKGQLHKIDYTTPSPLFLRCHLRFTTLSATSSAVRLRSHPHHSANAPCCGCQLPRVA